MGPRRDNHLMFLSTITHTHRKGNGRMGDIQAQAKLKIQLKSSARKKVFGQLVALGFDVAVFTPAPYQRRRLRRPSMEFSSRGGLRA